jgi:NADH dehydrogenase (ubiquinone) Fe-S protein 1
VFFDNLQKKTEPTCQSNFIIIFSGELKMADWEDVIITVAKVLDSTPGDRMAALVGGMADAETLVALKDLFNRLGCEDLCTESSFPMEYGGN